MIGKKFGRLTVIGEAPARGHYKYYLCLCDCGNKKEIYKDNLLGGLTSSCGCFQKEQAKKANLIHGFASGKKQKLYRVWAGMNNRCTCESNSSYENYGARGITVCGEWKDFLPFYKWATANGYGPGKQIDRIDNDGHYSPDNCRFVDRGTNCLNKRSNHRVTINGITKTISEWAGIAGIGYNTLWYRVHVGWKGSELLNPVGGNCSLTSPGTRRLICSNEKGGYTDDQQPEGAP